MAKMTEKPMAKQKQSLAAFLLSKKKLSIPGISILFSLFIGVLLMLLTGFNPAALFVAILRGTFGINVNSSTNTFNARYIGEFFVTVMPIALTGIAVAFSFRIGLFNIGAEGQLLVGSFAAILTGLSFPGLHKALLLPLVLINSCLAGAFWGAIPGILKARFNIHEVVVTIMLNYAALYATNYGYLQIPGSSALKTSTLPDAALLHSDFLSSITNNSRLHWGFLLVIFALILFWFLIEKTSFGYELRATGYNLHAAKFAGMKTQQNIMLSMTISGAFAGLAGAIVAVGTFSYGRVIASFENYGFDGIAVALVGNNTALGIFIASLLFGSFKAAQPIMQTRNVPRDIITIIIATVVLVLGMQTGIRILLENIVRKEKQKEKGLAETAKLAKTAGLAETANKTAKLAKTTTKSGEPDNV